MAKSNNAKAARLVWNSYHCLVSADHYAQFLPESRSARAALNALGKAAALLQKEADKIGVDLTGDEPEGER